MPRPNVPAIAGLVRRAKVIYIEESKEGIYTRE